MARLLFILSFLIAFPFLALAQHPARHSVQQSEEQKRVFLLQANTLSYDKDKDIEWWTDNVDGVDERVPVKRQVLTGDVVFRQDSVYMYCDLAYFYQERNSFKAFGNVRMQQGDTLFMYCDSLDYNGDLSLGKLYDNVRLIHNSTTLYTDYLTYDRVRQEANYPYTGVIVDPADHLRSQLGWYYPQSREAFFQYDVQLRNYASDSTPDFWIPVDYTPDDRRLKPRATLYSDTLRYNFSTNEATVLGDARIVNDTATLYTRRGIYHTRTLQSKLYDRSHIVSRGRYAAADTLFYDGTLGVGDAWGKVEMCDTLQHMKLLGDYGHYVDDPQMAFVTGHALALEFSGRDTLFMHADTLRSFVLTAPHVELVTPQAESDSLPVPAPYRDTLGIDTLRYMTAHHNVRYYREDLQGVCDSLHYSVRDSLATFVGNPIMWNGQYQITGDTIFAIIVNGQGIVRSMIHDNAFLVQQRDSDHYDQISGKDLVCYFDSSHVRQMDMSGNVQIIYFPDESDGVGGKQLIGLNQMIGNFMTVWFKDQRMDHLRVWPDVVGSLTPIQLVTPDILHLDHFRWMSYLRPTSPRDVFRDVRMKEEDQQAAVPLFNADELNGY